jgi:hypothetical protein
VPGVAETLIAGTKTGATATVSGVEEAEVPQAFTAATLIVPLVVSDVAVMLSMPAPVAMLHPPGKFQV